MGDIAYIGWAVLMGSAILFGTLLGILLGEWKGTGSRTRFLLGAGLVLLIASSVIPAYSGYLGKACADRRRPAWGGRDSAGFTATKRCARMGGVPSVSVRPQPCDSK